MSAVMSTVKPNLTSATRDPKSIVYPLGKDRHQSASRVTPFQWSVYDLVKEIPSGSVSTYGQIAKQLDTSPRAVGNALRNNPFCPLVPCHRVVATSGRLGGFFGETGSGVTLETKARMLREEEVTVNADATGFLIPPPELQARLWDPNAGQ